MSRFVQGDKVLVDGNLVAEVQVWDEENNRLVLRVHMKGGSTNDIYGHISSYNVERLVSGPVTGEDEPVEEPAEPEDDTDSE